MKRIKNFYPILLLSFLMGGCPSPLVNLDSARIHEGFNFSGYYQLRKIENNSRYRGEHGYQEKRGAKGFILKPAYGWRWEKTGMEAGIKIGAFEHYHWSFKEGSSNEYFPYTCADFFEGADIFYLNPFIKYAINQQRKLKLAFVAELPAGTVIVSYGDKMFIPYLSGRVSNAKYENPSYYWYEGTSRDGNQTRYYGTKQLRDKIVFLPAIGCEIMLGKSAGLCVEVGLVPDYYRNDDLYAFGIGVIF